MAKTTINLGNSKKPAPKWFRKLNGLKSYCDIQYENIVRESNKHYDKITKEIESTNTNTSELIKLMVEINGKLKT